MYYNIGDNIVQREKEKGHSEELEDDGNCASDEELCAALVQQLSCGLGPRQQSSSSHSILAKFIEKFLLECNTTGMWWQAHGLVVSLHTHSVPNERKQLPI